jgi:hypothetical protein
MSKIETNPFLIVPFCISHYNNPSTNTYYGFINYPTNIRDNNGRNYFKCLNPSPKDKNWQLYNTFYAFSPMIRPIPSGLKLINVENLIKNQHNTKNINYAYDPFDIEKNAISFMTWTQPVTGTVPLYLHISPDSVSYPSFEKTPPSPNKGWTEHVMSPVYVLVDSNTYPYKVDSNLRPLPTWNLNQYEEPEFKFIGSDNRCIPDINGYSIEKCFLLTDENVLQQNPVYGPTPILKRIAGYNQKINQPQTFNNFFKYIPPYVIVICGILFTLSLIACIILIGNK